jgi:flagellar basal-body rod modification protein FlgD
MTITPAGPVPGTQTSATSLHTTGAGVTAPKKTLDKEVFLALLVAQLRHQDPSSPMDTTQMMTQSTQLASMEQLTAVAETSRESFALQMRVAALGLVGQEVCYVDAQGQERIGIVSEVSFALDVPMVTVGDHTVPLDAISGARRPQPAPVTATPAVPGTGTTPAPSADGTTSTTDPAAQPA